jgi:hypothetical protein
MRLNLELHKQRKSWKNSDLTHNKFYFERITDAYTQSFALQTRRDKVITNYRETNTLPLG